MTELEWLILEKTLLITLQDRVSKTFYLNSLLFPLSFLSFLFFLRVNPLER